MALIEIHLREGWDDDRVQVEIDGVGCVDQYSVTTDYSIGLAWIERVSVQAGRHEVEVVVPVRDLAARLPVEVEDNFYLGVKIEDDRILFEPRSQPFDPYY